MQGAIGTQTRFLSAGRRSGRSNILSWRTRRASQQTRCVLAGWAHGHRRDAAVTPATAQVELTCMRAARCRDQARTSWRACAVLDYEWPQLFHSHHLSNERRAGTPPWPVCSLPTTAFCVIVCLLLGMRKTNKKKEWETKLQDKIPSYLLIIFSYITKCGNHAKLLRKWVRLLSHNLPLTLSPRLHW